MKRRGLLPMVVSGALVGSSLVVVAPAAHADTAAPGGPTAGQLAAAAAAPSIAVTFDKASGEPTALLPLTGVLAPAGTGTPGDQALAWLHAHADLYGLSAADLATLSVDQTIADPTATYVFVGQHADGLPVDGSQLRFTFDRNGQLVFTNGRVEKSVAAPAAATLSAGDAVAKALATVGKPVAAAPTPVAQQGDVLQFANPGPEPDPIEHTAQQVVFPVPGAGNDRRAWKTYVEDATGESFEVVVDASNGKVLLDQSQSSGAGPEGRVNTGQTPDSSPGGRVLTPFTGINGSWVSGAALAGNNASAYEDRDEDDAPDAGSQPTTAAAPDPGYQVFDYPFTDAWKNSENVDTDRDATVTQLFYYTNLMHDFLYKLGFTETWKNFQDDNFGKGGSASDHVNAEARDGYGDGTSKLCTDSGGTAITCRNNANFNTRPDGTPSKMQMYLFTGGYPDRDGSLDGDVIAHEYGHGLSGRLIQNGNLGVTNEAGSLGEGWSDVVSFMLWDDPVIGEYVTGNTTTGIRSVSYANSNRTYSQYSDTGEVHNMGEIWATVLWRELVALRARYGKDAGMAKFRQAVVDGMKNTAASPTMVTARDGFIAALSTANAPDTQKDYCLAWVPFANIGLGQNATGSGGADNTLPAACAPTAKVAGPVSTPEGTNVTLDASASTVGSADSASSLTYAWDFNGDGKYDDATGAKPTYTAVGQDGVATVSVQVTSSTGATATASTTVTVTNVAPAVSGTVTGPTDEGSLVTLQALVSDPGWQDPLTATLDWGDGTGAAPLTGTVENVRPDATLTATATHRYGDNGTYSVKICGSDDDTTTCTTKPWTVTNVAPAVTLSTIAPIAEGQSTQIKATFTDPGWLDTETATVDFGDGVGPRSIAPVVTEGGPGVPDSGTVQIAAPYGDNGTFAVKVAVTDDDGGVGMSSGSVVVSNVAPTLTLDKSATRTIQGKKAIVTDVTKTVPFSSTTTDPGSDDETISWDWNDGGASPDLTTTSLVNPPNPDPANSPTLQPRTVVSSPTHRFPTACTYTVANTVKDDDGGTAADSVDVVVFGDTDIAGLPIYWVGQYGYPGKRPIIGGADLSDAQLDCYLRIVRYFSPYFSTTRPVNTLKQATDVLDPLLPIPAGQSLDQSLLAGWLDIANGSINPGQGVDTNLDGRADISFIGLLRAAETARTSGAPSLTLLAYKAQIDKTVTLSAAHALLHEILSW